jgi:YegS/Rv2252/BmrU family lipid kinase
MPKRVLLAVNTRARRGRDARDRAAAALRARGHTVIELKTDGAPGALSQAIVDHAGEADLVAVGGGDGTIVSAIAGLRKTGLPLLALPLGTFNELARTLGILFDLEKAAALVDDGVPYRIDVAKANDFDYVNEASLGLSTSVARIQTGTVKRKLGMLAIPVTTLRAMRYARPFHVEVELDDGTVRRFRTIQLTVANSYRFGGVVENPDAAIDDGRLWLYVIDIKHWWSIAGILASIVLHRFPHAPDVIALRGHRFTVRTHRRRRVYADSEPATHSPVTFSVDREAIGILVPPDRVEAIR